MDNPKKKGLDAKRISLTQRHEVNYIRRRCRELIKLCEAEQNYLGEKARINFVIWDTPAKLVKFPVSTIKRIAKAFLKISKK